MTTRKKKRPAKRDVPEERLRQFVEAYMADPNGAAAAAAAGYKGDAKARSEQARRLLKRDDVKAMMEERVSADPAVWTREERQRFWTQVARGDKFEQVTLNGVVKAPAPLMARLRATEILGKSQGDFVERHEHKHTGAVELFVVQMPERQVLPEPEA